MALKMQMPELKCMEPEHYRKYFRITSWGNARRYDKKSKIGKKDKQQRSKANIMALCYAPALLWNPSQFAVFSTIRRTILGRWRHLQGVTSEFSDDSDDDESSCSLPVIKVPKITGIGLRAVFTLISQARFTDSQFCDHALRALLDVLQGHPPEELAQEPAEMITKLHAMLIEVSAGSGPSGSSESPNNLTAVSSSCLIALSVARGEAELILNAVASLIMSPPSLSEQYVQIPLNLTTLQRSVQSVILGSPSQNKWLHYGVPNQSLVTSFPVDLPSQLTAGSGELVVRSLVSDGCFLYVFTSRGLLKIGSGYGSSIKQHVYLYKPDFFASDRHGWLGYCKNKLYARIGRKKHEIFEIDKDTLESKYIIRLEPGNNSQVEPKSAVFTDGNQLGLIMLTNYDSLIIRMYDMDSIGERTEGINSMSPRKEMNVPLLRKRTLVVGRAPFEDGLNRRSIDLDAPSAIQLDDSDEDPLLGICAGQDFGLLTTRSGKVYYTGKGTSLGYKALAPHPGRWTLMKESMFTRNDASDVKKIKVVQVAVGHEGVHAILVLDNGTALFTGISRRGEDGDTTKHRRAPKPTRPKKIFKAEGHFIVYAACNYGSTALLTRQGMMFMFGKDTQHCDSTGLVTGLQHEKVIQVALGKAHAVTLTNFGLVYTLGINNKGQCGREFGYTKEKSYSPRPSRNEFRICPNTHTWRTEYCRVCVLCRECTGFETCQCANLPNRLPGEKCGCGEGDAGCSTCGICRRCAEAAAATSRPSRVQVTDLDDPEPDSSSKFDKDARYSPYEAHMASETEKEASLKVSCLPPARVAIPGGHRVCAVACGLHHTVLLTDHGEVLTFGSNQNGQLGAGDVSVYHRIVRVRVPRSTAIAAGSNHTAILTREGELYTFGSYQKGALGRPRIEEPARTDRSPIWYAVPGRVPRIGPRHACKAVWVSACGDQTFVQVSQAVVNTDTLFSSTITANSNCIVILPNRPEHTFKCVTINKADGTCNAWSGAEQVDFVNTLACIDPLYDVIWCYQPQMRVMKCFNILAFDSHKLQRCCMNDTYSANIDFEYPSYGSLKKLEDFKNLETLAMACNNEEKAVDNVVLSNMSILNQELAIPSAPGCSVTRLHAALHLLGCLDSLTFAHDNNFDQMECKREHGTTAVVNPKDEFLTVNRFESHGGGWGYSGHSVEAIRFMCDTDVMLGGYGLFGGRGDYTAKIKLFDIGIDGGDQEGDGELLAETDEILYECPPRDRFPVLFESPITIIAQRWYVAWACINGPSSDCGSSGQAVISIDEVGFHFKTSKLSNNGTDVNAGQIPCLLYNVIAQDQAAAIRSVDPSDPVIVLTKNISRKVTINCFKSLITLLKWSWTTFKGIALDTNGQIPINYHKLTVMKHQKRLVYVIRACLRLVKCYINEVYPQNKPKNAQDYLGYYEVMADVRNLIQAIMADPTPNCTMLPRKTGKMKAYRTCYVQFALELASSILKEAHDTVTACFHAFFPTPTVKWNHLCFLLSHLNEGTVSSSKIRELTASCAAMCASRSLRDVLQYIVPVTQNYLMQNENKRPDSKLIKEVPPSKSATVPRSSHASKPPPVPPRANSKDSQKVVEPELLPGYTEWHLLDVLPKLLDIVMIPIKDQMMTRQCGQPHDHGEIKQQEQLSEFCCKLAARVIAELSYSATDIMEDFETKTVKHLVTPSRFMRVSQSRCWNTGNGSPDAVCFTVDHPGVVLVGACVYGGIGSYEYSLELLHDVRQLRNAPDDSTASHCWVGLEQVQGTFTAADCLHDIVQIKFEHSVPLKEDLRYAIRLCNHGGRTTNGDCGLPSVKGPDDTTFRFSSCSLSFNGTTLARGQIPSLIYYGTSKASTALEATDSYISALRNITLRLAALIMERSAELFCTLRNELTAEDLRRNASVLQQSPAINVLLPYILANLEGMDDAKSAIKILEMVHKLLPHVAAMNLLVPNNEESNNTTSNYYTWVESDHPYKQATVTNMRVLFPQNVSWMVLEMDSRSITAQSEDNMTIYAVAGTPKQKCHCVHDTNRPNDPPFRRVYKKVIPLTDAGEAEEICEDTDGDSLCSHYNCTYISITPRMSNQQTEWPQRALVVPGNEAIFSLETASDYLNEYNKPNNEDSRYGFRCLCVGYEDTTFTTQRQGLVALETELIYIGGACASCLLAPDLDIPPLTFSTLVEVQMQAMMGGSPTGSEGEAAQDASETLLLSRGMELTSPPTVHHVLDGQPLIRCVSTERQFLMDFVSGAESTAGGRLARWLAPAPQVDPARCEIKAPPAPVRPATRVNIPIVIRDQYGDAVSSPALKVEVVVQRLEERQRMAEVPYHPTLKDSICFHVITMMKAYQDMSFEELRLASGSWGKSRTGAGTFVPAERLPVHAQPDGTYYATWTPRTHGFYIFRCTFDDQPAPQELRVEVVDTTTEGVPEKTVQAGGVISSNPAMKLRRFVGKHSAGLRIRSSPSLQAEELGFLPPGSNISFVEEVMNKDGTWVRLSSESARAHLDGSTCVAWCLQHHRQYDRVLLVPIEPCSPTQLEYTGVWSGYGNSQGDMQWMQEEEDVSLIEDKRSPFSVRNDDTDETDGGSSPFVYGKEPSKRVRSLRKELASLTPKRFQRKSNGNSDEWWSPVKQRPSDNIREVTIVEVEIDVEPELEHKSSSHLAQTGTQTSPESVGEEMLSTVHLYIDNKEGSKSTHDRLASRSRAYRRSSPPPLPVRVAPAPPPKKHALSPGQAECMRAIFAALLWHEGIVHDAIACAAFLKFHPQLPKQGARVVTRTAHEVTPHTQRHSVEVSNAGQYLLINPSTMESLNRSGAEASASRLRKADIELPIKEEDGHARSETESPLVVNVLPPALRAIVGLWDTLYEADQLATCTDKFRKDNSTENNENGEPKSSNETIYNKEVKPAPNAKNPAITAVRCELCGGIDVSPPLAAHMRNLHPGCRALAAHGYDRAGSYRRADQPPAPAPTANHSCGQLAQAYQLWYIYCEKCRDKSIKASIDQPPIPKHVPDLGYDRVEILPEIDHNTIKENALFLLDLAPLTNSEQINNPLWQEAPGRSPPTPPGSLWQPAPPFQVLPALGAAPKSTAVADAARYHSLGRPPQPAAAQISAGFSGESHSGSQISKVHRSISMGQAGGRDLAHAARPTQATRQDPTDTLSGGGSSLLSMPSAALQRLVGCRVWDGEGCAVSAFETPQVDGDALIKSPVLSFVLARRDLHAFRQKMDANVRINTIRQYGFEALNWLLRSTTQPMGVHDVMWWFCNALEKYSRIVPPPLTFDDNKENIACEYNRSMIPTASASAICPGGQSARGVRAAFHAFLGSISALAPSLPPASVASLQAVRCWALHYSPYDRAFLHRSQVFSVVSKILSHSEESAYDDGVLGALQESFHSYLNKENFVWSCPDVTGWCDISVSSRQGMAGALSDGSTETFWESGDEDRNKAKWIEILYPGGAPDDRPHVVCVHVDNTRDTANKTVLMSFLYSSGSSEMFHMMDVDMDPKAASWVSYTLPRISSPMIRVRVELRGPEPAVRVRQVRVLGPPAPLAIPGTPAARVLHSLCEGDTLKVFRLLTSQVFGKLLEWERSGSDANGEGSSGDDVATVDDTDLREHVVGILFARHKLTSLQRQVMSHIVTAIGCEAGRVRDDWETALLCAEADRGTSDSDTGRDRSEEQLPKLQHQQDNYCFEMLSLLLALSGSSVGRVHLAQRTELLGDLLGLLHTGSERVQRQVISLLRRMIMEIPPQKMLVAINYGTDMNESCYGCVSGNMLPYNIQLKAYIPTANISLISLLDHLLCYLGKAITVQVKVKGSNSVPPGTVMMGTSVTPSPPAPWFMRGETTKKHAQLVAKLISDMAEDKISNCWSLETRTSLANYASQVAQVSESDRRPARCIALPTLWLSLGALCVCEQSYIDQVNGSEGLEARARESDTRPFCANHDDAQTLAVIECRTCGPLCAECDRFLHLNRAARSHHRQICKEEESAIRIDIHEGCGRAKLFWLLLLVDRRTLKGLAEFRGMENVCDVAEGLAATGPPPLAGTCRFCGTRGNSGLLAIGNVCADQQCQEYGRDACSRVLACNHLCGGVRGERTCLPCLFGCSPASDAAPLRQDADDMCMICFTDPLQAAPALQLKCGHVFHLHCCKKVLANKWNGPRITFSFSQCPICKDDMNHWTLDDLLSPIRRLRDEVRRKALMRLEYEGLAAGAAARGRASLDPATYAMERYAYYVCHKCGKAYFGGLARCEAESSGWWEPAELVCGACSDVAGARICPKHGSDFLEYKCRYCCSVAVFFCFGTSHFCNACHDDFQRVTNIAQHLLPQCPAGPKGEQLPGTSEECPLHVQHPATGEEFALGCGVCRHAHAF